MCAGRSVNESMAKYAARNVIRMLAGSGVKITSRSLYVELHSKKIVQIYETPKHLI